MTYLFVIPVFVCFYKQSHYLRHCIYDAMICNIIICGLPPKLYFVYVSAMCPHYHVPYTLAIYTVHLHIIMMKT